MLMVWTTARLARCFYLTQTGATPNLIFTTGKQVGTCETNFSWLYPQSRQYGTRRRPISQMTLPNGGGEQSPAYLLHAGRRNTSMTVDDGDPICAPLLCLPQV